jgi:heptosyltransferase-2
VNKVLIIQTAFLGDVILATPVATELKRIYPKAEIDMLVKKGNEELLYNNPNISQIIVFDKSQKKLKTIISLLRNIRSRKYDFVINLHRFSSSGILTIFSGAKKKYGFKKNPLSFAYSKSFEHDINKGIHEVERNLSIIKEFGASFSERPIIFPVASDYEKVANCHKPYFCFAPASIWETKQLPEAKWIALIQRKSNDGFIYLIGGPNDKKRCDHLLKLANVSNALNLSGSLSLLESAALMKNAQMNYVNDSGPLHIASAMNAPVTAFFCSTTPNFGFGPLSDEKIIIETKIELPCRPCGIHGFKACPKGHFDCGNQIDLNEVK